MTEPKISPVVEKLYYKPLTALQVLDDRSVSATRNADRYRDDAKTRQERDAIDMKSYRSGEAYAYMDARKVMEAELRRLCNKFQNGSLTVADFGVIL